MMGHVYIGVRSSWWPSYPAARIPYLLRLSLLNLQSILDLQVQKERRTVVCVRTRGVWSRPGIIRENELSGNARGWEQD